MGTKRKELGTIDVINALREEELKKISIEEGREVLTGDEVDAMIELNAAVGMIADSSVRLERFLTRHKLYKHVRAGMGLVRKGPYLGSHHIDYEQLRYMVNLAKYSQICIAANEALVPDTMTVFELDLLQELGRAAVEHCQMGCDKTAKQAKHCPLRRALMHVPGAADAAKDTIMFDENKCIFCQI